MKSFVRIFTLAFVAFLPVFVLASLPYGQSGKIVVDHLNAGRPDIYAINAGGSGRSTFIPSSCGIASSISSSSQQSSQDNPDSPSLAETLKFIREKIDDYGVTYCCEDSSNYSRSVEKIAFTDNLCQTISTYKIFYNEAPASPTDFESKFYFGDIEASGIAAVDASKTQGKNIWKVYLPVIDNANKVITNVTVWNFERTTIKSQGNRNENAVRIFVRDQEIAERLAHAFQHAVTLCGKMKKTDPF